jgi:hypothetical protein
VISFTQGEVEGFKLGIDLTNWLNKDQDSAYSVTYICIHFSFP